MMEHWRAFGPEWFERHQGALLWLLRAPLIGRWFRWCLRIRACDIGHAREIIEIRPHCYTVAGDEPDTLTTDFRTHWKYSKRLYYAFRPLWWALHWWDALVAEPFAPRLSFGLPTLTAYPDPDPETNTVDGKVANSGAPLNWASLILSAGNASFDAIASSGYIDIVAGASNDTFNALSRAIFLFDTSAVLTDFLVQTGTLSMYGTSKNDGLAATPDIVAVSSNPASNTSLSSADFATLGSTLLSTALPYSSFNTSAYNDFNLNDDGKNAIVPGISKFGLRNQNYDISGSAPPWVASQDSSIQGFYADQTGTAEDPKLVVQYSLQNKIIPPNRMRPAVFSPGIAR